MKLEVRGVGKNAGIVIPKHLMTRLGLKKGDAVFLTETPNGFRVVYGDPEFERDMTFAEQVMKKRGHALRELAN